MTERSSAYGSRGEKDITFKPPWLAGLIDIKIRVAARVVNYAKSSNQGPKKPRNLLPEQMEAVSADLDCAISAATSARSDECAHG